MNWKSEFRDILRENVSLANRTWLGVGGATDWLAEPTSVEQLATLVRHCREAERPIRLLGSGSNVLVRDEGVRGVVVSLAAGDFVRIDHAGNEVRCGGGATLAHVISETVGAGLAGLETMVGIPGTVGGALHNNAGSHGGDMGQWTQRATVITRSGDVHQRQRQDMVFAYRQSSLDELAIVEATFALEEEDPILLAKRMQKQWIATKANQPMSHERTACIFKEAGGMSAEMLIDQAGLNNLAFGGAEVSDRHANFIVTHHGATAADVLKLIDLLCSGVAERMGVELQLQLEIW